MAKKTAKTAPTVCEQGGDELLPFIIPARPRDDIDFTIFICRANARVRVWIRELPIGPENLLADESGPSEVSVQLPALSTGRYLLRWSVLTPSPDWQTRAEIAVASTTAFRHRKSAAGNNPVNMGIVQLELK